MVASIPCASGPQAVVWALWAASFSPEAVALAQFWLVPNATHTSHSTFCADTVVHARKATNARIASTTRNLRDIGPSFLLRAAGIHDVGLSFWVCWQRAG